MTDSTSGEQTPQQQAGPAILGDHGLSPRLRTFLADHVTVHPRTSASHIRHRARATSEDGQDVPVPAGAIEAMLEFEERFGGLAYTVPGWPNWIEYGSTVTPRCVRHRWAGRSPACSTGA